MCRDCLASRRYSVRPRRTVQQSAAKSQGARAKGCVLLPDSDPGDKRLATKGLGRQRAMGVFDLGLVVEQECPCGFIDATSNCTQTGFTDRGGDDDVAASVTTFPGGECTADQSYRCVVLDAVAKCVCLEGYEGAVCEDRVEAELWNVFLSGIIIPSLVLMYCAYTIRIHDRRNARQDFHFRRSATVEGYGSVGQLLVFRSVAFVSAALLQLMELIASANDGSDRGASWPYRFLTVWAFHFFILYFGIGTLLSWRAWRHGVPEGKDTTRLEGAFKVLMEIQITLSIIICGVVWAIGFPDAKESGNTVAFLLPWHFYQHAGNVVVILVDYALNGLVITKAHAKHTVVFVALYAILHGLLMLLEDAQGLPHRPSYLFLSSTNNVQALFVVAFVVVTVLVYYVTTTLNFFLDTDEQADEFYVPPSKRKSSVILKDSILDN